MTIQEFSKKIKEKYPEYQSVDDSVLVNKIIEKYPEYKNQVILQDTAKPMSGFKETVQDIKEGGQKLKETITKTKDKISDIATAGVEGEQGKLRSFGQAFGAVAGGVSSGIGDIFTTAVKMVLPQKAEEKLKEGVSSVVSKAIPMLNNLDEAMGRPVGTFIDNYKQLPDKSKRDVDALLGVSMLAIDSATLGAGKKLGEKGIKEGINVAKKTKTATKEGIGTALQTTGTIGERAGKNIISTALPSKEAAERVLSYKAKTSLKERFSQAVKGVENAPITPADVAVKYNILGVSRTRMGVKAKQVANELFENQVKPVLSGIKEKVKKSDIFTEIQNTINQTADISRRKSYQKAFNALKEDYKHVSSWSVKKLDEIKSSLANRLPSKVWKGEEIAGDMNNIRKMFADEARKAVRNKLPKNIISIYDDYGSLLEIQKMGVKAIQAGLNQNMIGLTGELFRMTTVPTVTAVGVGASKLGTAIKKLGTKIKGK